MVRFFVCAAVMMAAVSPAHADGREPVLKQVTAPHSYYWREMYVPQLTSGPSSLAWSRDGKSLYYSMQGRIWRQRLDSARAEQITSAAGYDYQPDISPDGKRLVFARYQNDAINLVIRDLGDGREIAITDNGAVNVDPRWSPDGTRIAYVTTAESGNFHIAIAERKDGKWQSRRWRPERQSEPRYYYSATDHELSPTWSSDGKELLFVSNPDVIHGSGWIYRQPLDLSAPATLIRQEETNWKTRPDWSPDGSRVVYSSYLGRQWLQLWVIAADEGAYPIPLTYGEHDITGARWSPDGTKLAYISNEGGDGAIVIHDVVGGAKRTLAVVDRRYAASMGRLAVQMRDEEGKSIAARISVRGSDGRDYAPDAALIHADDYFDRSTGAFETHYFHADGEAMLSLPPGAADITVWRGLEAAPVRERFPIPAGKTAAVGIVLDRLALSEELAEWRSGDVHTHMNYGGAYRMTPEKVAAQAAAEDLDLVFNLIVNKEQRVPDIGYFSPQPQRVGDAVIAQAQEFHTSVWGHVGFLGLDDHVLIMDYAGYPKTGASSLYPDNATVADLAQKQGALVGYVHPYDPPAPDPSGEGKLTHSLPIDVALGKVDYVEIVGFSDHRVTEEVWRRLLNCGFRIPAAAGTDAMTNYASLRGPLGVNRTYVHVGADPPEGAGAFTRAWLDALKAGKSFATNGPLLSFEVEGQGPGGELKLGKGAHKLKVSARMESIASVDALEIVVNGDAAASIPLTDDSRKGVFAGEIDVAKSGWIMLRASSKTASPDVFDLYPFAVTSPIYVTVGGKPARSREDAEFFLAWIDRVEAFAKASDAWNNAGEKKAVLANIAKARREFEKRRN